MWVFLHLLNLHLVKFSPKAKSFFFFEMFLAVIVRAEPFRAETVTVMPEIEGKCRTVVGQTSLQYWCGELSKVGEVQGAIRRHQGKCMRVMGCPVAALPAGCRIASCAMQGSWMRPSMSPMGYYLWSRAPMSQGR
jgi:hypothetical protein